MKIKHRKWQQLFAYDDASELVARYARAVDATPEIERALDAIPAGALARDGPLTRNYTHSYTRFIPGGEGAPVDTRSNDLSLHAGNVPALLRERVHAYALKARSATTIASYQSHLHIAEALAQQWGRSALPMEVGTACAMIAAQADAGYHADTIRGFASAVRFAHIITGNADPTRSLAFEIVLQGIMKTLGREHVNQKCALIREDLHSLMTLAAQHRTVKAAQQCAMIALTYWAALRRRESHALDLTDLLADGDDLLIHLRRSKTDQYGKGAWLRVKRYDDDPVICPVRNLRRWIGILSQSRGPLFRRLQGQHFASDGRVGLNWLLTQLKSLGKRAGMDAGEIGTHSLRAGWATQAILDGVSEIKVAVHLRHSDLHTLPDYFRPGKRKTNVVDALFPEEP